MFGNDRQQLRQMYKLAWEKYQQKQSLSALEQQVAQVILEHPEYHQFVQQMEKDFLPELGESNPFLHMGLHLGLREQVSTNRPAGIRDVFDTLCKKGIDPHDVEHRMIECLAEAMWSAQQNQQMPDEQSYLSCLHKLLK